MHSGENPGYAQTVWNFGEGYVVSLLSRAGTDRERGAGHSGETSPPCAGLSRLLLVEAARQICSVLEGLLPAVDHCPRTRPRRVSSVSKRIRSGLTLAAADGDVGALG